MPLLVVQLPQGIWYSSEDMSSRLDSAVKCCNKGLVKGLARESSEVLILENEVVV